MISRNKRSCMVSLVNDLDECMGFCPIFAENGSSVQVTLKK